MSIKTFDELLAENEEKIKQRRAAKIQQEREKALSLLPDAPKSVTPEAIEMMQNMYLDYQGIKNEIAEKKQTQQSEGAATSIAKTGASVLTELSVGFGGSYLTKGGPRAAKLVKNLQLMMKGVRAARAGAVAVAGTPTPQTVVAGATGLALTEGGSWFLGNLASQTLRKALGDQDEYKASELIAAGAFGIIATPADKFITGAGRKFLSKRIPLKVSGEGIGFAFKAKERVIIKGVPTVISGASIGVAETALRDTVGIMLGEEGEFRDATEYWLAAGIGGGLNSIFHIFAKTGAWGRAQAGNVTERAVERVKERLSLLQKDLAKAKKAAASPRIGIEKSDALFAVKKLNKEIKEQSEAIALIQDFGDKIKEEARVAAKQEVNPAPEVIVRPDPIEEPTVTSKETETPEAKTEPPPLPKVDEKLEVSPEKTERVINDLTKRLKTLEQDIISGKITKDNFDPTEWAAIVNKTTKLLDALEFDTEQILRQIIKEGATPALFKNLQRNIDAHIKFVEFKAPMTAVSGNVVNFSNPKKSWESETAEFSIANSKELEALRNFKRYLDSVVDKSDDDSFFADTAQEYLDTKDTFRRNQRKKAREEAKEEQVVNLETRVKELEEKLAEKKKVASGKTATQPKTAKEKAEAQLEKEQQDFVEGKQDESPKKAAKEEDAELQELRERIAFYKKNKKEAAEIEELEASIDRLSKLGKEGDPEKISKLVSGKPKWAGIKKVKSYLEDLRSVDRALRRELKESLKPQKTPEEKMQDALNNRIQKLEKQLKEARGRAVGPDAKAADELAGETTVKKEDPPEVKELQAALNTYKRFEREAANYDAAVAEAERLKEILKRGDAAEMQQEVGRMPDNLKDDSVKSAYDKAVKEVKKRKAVMRRFLTEASKKEGKKAKAARDKELYENMLNVLNKGQDADKGHWFMRLVRRFRAARKASLINSAASAAAAFPTGIGEVFLKNPLKAAAFLIYGQKGYKTRFARAALSEAFIGIGQFFSLFNPGSLKRLKPNQVQRMFGRAFNEAVNPQTATSRFELETNAYRTIFPTGIRRVLTKAKNNAKLQEEGKEYLRKWISKEMMSGNLWNILALGMKTITGTDAAFSKINLDVAVRTRFKQQAIIEFPNNPSKAEKRFNQLLEAAQKDESGLILYEIDEEINDMLDLVRESMLMASSADGITSAKTMILDEVANNLSRMMNDDSRPFLAFIMEALMPFVGPGIRGAQRGLNLSGVALIKATYRLARPNKKYQNIFDKVKKEHEETIKQLEILKYEAKKAGNTTEALRIEKQIQQEQALADLADTRRVMENIDTLGTALVTVSLFSIGAMASKMGFGYGSNSHLTNEQKTRDKTKQEFTLFGMDISSWAPFVSPLVLIMDIINYFKAREEGTIAKDIDLPTVVKNSLKATVKEMPMNQGLKAMEDIFGEDSEKFWTALANTAGGYILPIPSQVRKRVENATREGTMNELRGENSASGFWARVWYGATGAAAPNKKRDVFGRIRESGRTIEFEFNRFATKEYSEPTFTEKQIANDKDGVITFRLSKQIRGIDLFSYRNKDGYTLYSAYADIVEKREILQKLENILTNKSNSRNTAWLRDLNIKERIGESEDFVNLGHARINRFIMKEHESAKKELLKNETLLKDFINSEGKTAFEVFEERGTRIEIPSPINP